MTTSLRIGFLPPSSASVPQAVPPGTIVIDDSTKPVSAKVIKILNGGSDDLLASLITQPKDLAARIAVGGVVGWAWDKVIQGIYTWFANGLLLLMEWVWGVLDRATTPRLTEAWFTEGLLRPLAGISVGITVAMMLASGIQAALAGRPEQILDAVRQGERSVGELVDELGGLHARPEIRRDIAWWAATPRVNPSRKSW